VKLMEQSAIKSIRYILLIICLLGRVFAQQNDETGQKSAAEIAKELANPNATLGFLAFPVDYTLYDGDLPDAGSRSGFRLNFQPSLPYPISEGVNIFFRPLIPLIFTHPVVVEQGFENRGIALGDIAFDAAVGKSWKSGWVTIGGIFSSIPTATDEQLGSGRWTLGPNVFFGHAMKWGFLGVLVSQTWSITGNAEGASSLTSGQYFYTINLKGAWQIKAQPTYSYNHKAPAGSRLTLPLGIGIFNTWLLGNVPVQLGLQYWYYIERPAAFGPQHQIRLQITPVIPLPW